MLSCFTLCILKLLSERRMSMPPYDVAIAWCWSYDQSFVLELQERAANCGLSVLIITESNIVSVTMSVRSGELIFGILFDRAAYQDGAFFNLVYWAIEHQIPVINDFNRARWAVDKATMHLELLSCRIQLPCTFILPPASAWPVIDSPALEVLPRPFVVKSAPPEAGEGVHLNVLSWVEDLQIRQEFPEDKYLIQEKIEPLISGSLKYWFRVFWVCGEVIPCLWENQSRVYKFEALNQLNPEIPGQIEALIRVIASVCRLDLFSSAIVASVDTRLVVIDPVNDQLGLRKQSAFVDGVPDSVVERITRKLVQRFCSLKSNGWGFISQPHLRQNSSVVEKQATLTASGNPDLSGETTCLPAGV